MPATRLPAVCRVTRLPPRANLLLGLLASAALPLLAARADETSPEPIIPRLEFRVMDVRPDGEPSDKPLKTFHYSFTLYTAGEKKPIKRGDHAYRSDDGILRLPNDVPPFGRVRVWITADDFDVGYRAGYGEFSYRLDDKKDKKTAEPPVIQLDLGVVLTGRVLDADTGKPIAAAEVAPMKWGHHFDWADWDEAVKTDRDGRYRIGTGAAMGIAARHPGYRDEQDDNGPWGFDAGHNKKRSRRSEDSEKTKAPNVGPDGFVFQLRPLLVLRGRVVDPSGKPVADASANVDRCGSVDSDAEGRFQVKVTREEWQGREDRKVAFYSSNYRSLNVPMKDFSLDRELTVTLQPEPVVHGQIFDENGKPLEDCKVELKCETDGPGFRMVGSFYAIEGPYRQGKWKKSVSDSDNVFVVRVSVGGTVRSLKQYTKDEVTRGPIITRLAEGRRLDGRLIANIPLDENNMPAVILSRDGDEQGQVTQQATVGKNGRFAFLGLTDGPYTLRLHPQPYGRRRGGAGMNPGVGGFSTFGADSLNKPWHKTVTIRGDNLRLDPIDLHTAGVLPGRVTGTIFQPADGTKPLANAFGYVCDVGGRYDTVGGFYYLINFMTDADGRFTIDRCPPGDYILQFDANRNSGGRGASVRIRVAPEKTTTLRLFEADAKHRFAVKFNIGDGSSRDVHAGCALDADAIARHIDPKTGKLPFINDDKERFLATPSELVCEIEPLDATIAHWPERVESVEFSPARLLSNRPRNVAFPNVSPGRWRLTVSAVYSSVYTNRETLLTREFTFAESMPPLQIDLLPASLTGTFKNPVQPAFRPGDYETIEAIPKQPGLPTRTCYGQRDFRFLGLAPGEYTVRILAGGCREERLEHVIVEKGKVTRLPQTTLKPSKAEKPPAEKQSP